MASPPPESQGDRSRTPRPPTHPPAPSSALAPESVDATQTFRFAPAPVVTSTLGRQPAHGAGPDARASAPAPSTSTSKTTASFAPPLRRFQPTSAPYASSSGLSAGGSTSRVDPAQGALPLAASLRRTNVREPDDLEIAGVDKASPSAIERARAEGQAASQEAPRPPSQGVSFAHLRLGKGFSSPNQTPSRVIAGAVSSIAIAPPRSAATSHDTRVPSQPKTVPHKRAFSNESLASASSSVQSQPRPSTDDSTSNASRQVSSGAPKRGPSVDAPEKKKRRISSNRFEEDAKEIFGAVSDMVHELKLREQEIAHLRQQVKDQMSSAEKLSLELSEYKEVSQRAREAINRADAARREMETASQEMKRNVNRSRSRSPNLDGSSIAEFRELCEEVERLRKDVAELDTPHKLEKVEETKLSVLRELQLQLTNRDDVIKLLRGELEQKTGELVEARNSISTLEDRRSLLETKLSDATAEVVEARKESLEKRNKIAEQLEEALVSAGEREQAFTQKLDDVEAKWREKVEQAMQGEEEAKCQICEFQVKTREQEREADVLSERITTLEHERQEEAQRYKDQIEGLRRDLGASHERYRSLETTSLDEKAKILAQVHVLEGQVELLRPLRAEVSTLTVQLAVAQRTLEETVRQAQEAREAYERSLHEERQCSNLAREGHADAEAALRKKEDELSVARDEIGCLKEELERGDPAAVGELANLTAQYRILGETAAGLRTSLEQSRASVEQQETQKATLAARLADSNAQREAVMTELEEVRQAEADREEQVKVLQERLEAVQDELEKVREEESEATKAEVRKAMDVCDERHSIQTVDLQNELKKKTNQLQDMTRKYNKVANELAKTKNKPVLNATIGSSSNPESLGGNSNGSGAEKQKRDAHEAPGEAVEAAADVPESPSSAEIAREVLASAARASQEAQQRSVPMTLTDIDNRIVDEGEGQDGRHGEGVAFRSSELAKRQLSTVIGRDDAEPLAPPSRRRKDPEAAPDSTTATDVDPDRLPSSATRLTKTTRKKARPNVVGSGGTAPGATETGMLGEDDETTSQTGSTKTKLRPVVNKYSSTKRKK